MINIQLYTHDILGQKVSIGDYIVFSRQKESMIECIEVERMTTYKLSGPAMTETHGHGQWRSHRECRTTNFMKVPKEVALAMPEFNVVGTIKTAIDKPPLSPIQFGNGQRWK